MPPVAFQVAETTSNVLPVPWTFAPESVGFTITAFGGDESAEASGLMPARAAVWWLEQLQGLTRVVDRHGVTVWIGLLHRVEVDDGRAVTATTLDGMANRVLAAYTVRGGQRFTATAEDASSVTRYQYHDALLSVGEATQAAAEAARDRYLAERAWPRREVGASLSQGIPQGQARVTLQARGYCAGGGAVDFVIGRAIGSGSSGVALSNLVYVILTAGAPGNNFNVDYSTSTYYTQPSVPRQTFNSLNVPATNGYENLGEVLRRYIALGDTSGERVAWGVRHLRRGSTSSPRVFYGQTWAAATPTTIGYLIGPPGAITTGDGAPVSFARVRPDAMVQRRARPARPFSSSAVDGGERFYCGRTVYRWARGRGEELALESLGEGGVAALLAQVKP